jgi:hypothetical protein
MIMALNRKIKKWFNNCREYLADKPFSFATQAGATVIGTVAGFAVGPLGAVVGGIAGGAAGYQAGRRWFGNDPAGDILSLVMGFGGLALGMLVGNVGLSSLFIAPYGTYNIIKNANYNHSHPEEEEPKNPGFLIRMLVGMNSLGEYFKDNKVNFIIENAALMIRTILGAVPGVSIIVGAIEGARIGYKAFNDTTSKNNIVSGVSSTFGIVAGGVVGALIGSTGFAWLFIAPNGVKEMFDHSFEHQVKKQQQAEEGKNTPEKRVVPPVQEQPLREVNRQREESTPKRAFNLVPEQRATEIPQYGQSRADSLRRPQVTPQKPPKDEEELPSDLSNNNNVPSERSSEEQIRYMRNYIKDLETENRKLKSERAGKSSRASFLRNSLDDEPRSGRS